MSLALFYFSDDSEERIVTLRLNRFKTCHVDAKSQKYVLDTQIEDGINRF